MKKSFPLALYLLLWTLGSGAQPKAKPVPDHLPADRAAIRSMAGIYRVTFDFAETFSPDTAYQYHDRKHDQGIEYVFVLEETEKKISLQHLLIVSDSIVIKHWRQDWIYENTELYGYYKDNQWIKTTLTHQEVKGQWTQKVYQVDDSPRYEATGTWIHVDGKHYWEGSCDAPLPRREFTVRNDYNVLRRHSRIVTDSNGWYLEQDNEKILRGDGIDRLICWEKGMEKFTTGRYNAQPAKNWWEQNKVYWADVRKIWEEIYSQNQEIKLSKKIENKTLFEQLFKTADDYAGTVPYDQETAKAAIRKTIQAFMIKN